jgi:hypothetical protein
MLLLNLRGEFSRETSQVRPELAVGIRMIWEFPRFIKDFRLIAIPAARPPTGQIYCIRLIWNVLLQV